MFSTSLAICTTAFDVEDIFPRDTNSYDVQGYQRGSKVLRICSATMNALNTAYQLGGVCFPPVKWLQVAVESGSVALLVVSAIKNEQPVKKVLPKVLCSILYISRILYEMRGVSSSIVHASLVLDKNWGTIATFELGMRILLISTRARPT